MTAVADKPGSEAGLGQQHGFRLNDTFTPVCYARNLNAAPPGIVGGLLHGRLPMGTWWEVGVTGGAVCLRAIPAGDVPAAVTSAARTNPAANYFGPRGELIPLEAAPATTG